MWVTESPTANAAAEGHVRRLLARAAAAAALTCALLAGAQPVADRLAPVAPNLDALPAPLPHPPLDLEALARGYAQQADPATGLPARSPGLVVFISLTMPRPTLERLLDQSARAGASVVLRGFVDGSLRQTVAQLQALLGRRAIPVQIDPPAFDRFGITRVPSFVLLRDGARPAGCAAGHCPPPQEFLQLAGDVSLDHALAHMQRAAPAFTAETQLFLSRLQP